MKAGPKSLTAAPTATNDVSSVHTGLTVDDVDTIHRCRDRILSAFVLLELGLRHMDDDDPWSAEPEDIQSALLDVVDRLREDVTRISVTIELPGGRQSEKGGAA